MCDNINIKKEIVPSLSSIFRNDAVSSQIDSPATELMFQVDLSRILIIYTGGTIGMQNTPDHGYIPVNGYLSNKLAQNERFHEPFWKHEPEYNVVRQSVLAGMHTEMIHGIPVKAFSTLSLTTPASLYNKRIKYSILEYSPLLDSSNMDMCDWVKIATDIEVNYELYDAFLVLHGTDTMSYTASALSFLLENLGKTVIMTGSQVPLSEVRTDAVDNLLGALTIAGHFTIPEVGLFFDNKLLRGNRSSKINANEFNAFDSANLTPLVSVGINIEVSWDDVWKPKLIAKFRAHKILDPSVASLRLFPGITKATVQAFFSPAIKGIVLETYGSGNAPSNRTDLMDIIKNACSRGVVVINCSQCKRATVTSLYQTGIALLKIGVIPGADMTPECALAKLSYLLGKYDNPDQVRRMVGQNLRGELTVVSKKPRFTYLPYAAGQDEFINSIMALIGVPSTPSAFEPMRKHSISSMIDVQLIPIAMCHTAGTGDMEGLTFLAREFGSMINTTNEGGMVNPTK